MTTPFDCALNGVSLSRQDDRLCVLDIDEQAPKLRLTAAVLPTAGQQLLAQSRESLSVEVRFAIQEEDPRLRRQALQKVLAWAMKGGILTTSDRKNQQLNVVCTALPAMAAEDWTAPLSITFTTTRCPYWEDAALTQCAGTSCTVALPGTADSTPVSAQITNTGTEAITSLTLYCGATYMTFEGITLPAGGVFLLEAEDGLLCAAVDGASVLSCRTPGSSDLLLAPCGQSAALSVTAAGTVTATFSARGRYV